ncbi:MAG: hypothetical protein K8R18_17220 [Parvibaculum sp.]|uniref:hypothetical protein n=1 Tax=Parvibaculum sp. TaxID=2024848 RepID=UPI0025D19673|nr:hypothetical protein [Parvibaculum sp.]MCE9651364.1 hypothetical protein [Parvibaculum sp.]
MSLAQTAAAPRHIPLKRAALGLTALFMFGNAAYMLADPFGWYGAVAGVPDTGPFNPHFVRDIGVAYLTLAILSGAAALWLRQAFLLMSAVTLYLGLHVGLHLWDIAAGRLDVDHLIVDAPGVLGPTLVAAALVYWTRNDRA